MSEFLIFLLMAVTAGFCFKPFFDRRSLQTLSTRDTPLGRVEQRKETLLQNIAELDFENSMGKLSEDDYQSLRATLKTQAAESIEQIDVLLETEGIMSTKPKGGSAPAKAARFCSACGAAAAPKARFCSSCGQELT
jgi:cytochrome c-type biogenesis protein CcmH/NrfG